MVMDKILMVLFLVYILIVTFAIVVKIYRLGYTEGYQRAQVEIVQSVPLYREY